MLSKYFHNPQKFPQTGSACLHIFSFRLFVIPKNEDDSKKGDDPHHMAPAYYSNKVGLF